jgi:hypothetical protein
MANINYTPVCKKIESLIKKELRDGGHVKTGKLLKSIEVKYNGNGFDILAEEYYTYLDEEFGITEAVFNSDEFINFMENFLSDEIEKQIKI